MIKQIALDIIESIRERIVSDECSDEELLSAVSKIHHQTSGYFKEEDYVNYDQALKILGLSHNRAKLNKLCKDYGIKNVKFNNANIGFPKKDIEQLAKVLKNKTL